MPWFTTIIINLNTNLDKFFLIPGAFFTWMSSSLRSTSFHYLHYYFWNRSSSLSLLNTVAMTQQFTVYHAPYLQSDWLENYAGMFLIWEKHKSINWVNDLLQRKFYSKPIHLSKMFIIDKSSRIRYIFTFILGCLGRFFTTLNMRNQSEVE